MHELRLIFAGSGEFGLPTLRRLIELGCPIVQVISQPDRPAGRGRKMTPTPVASYALERSLPVLRTPNINLESLPPADVMVVIAFGQKISEAQVHHPRLGSINLHGSRLPRHRGAAPINWAIISGDPIVGNSVIRLAPRMDAGAVLAQSELVLGELETAGELHDRLAIDGADLVLRALSDLASGAAVETPQDELLATLAPKLNRESTHLDWSRPAEVLARQIRGLFPWPGCRVELLAEDGRVLDRVTLAKARPLAATTPLPGQINRDLSISTGAGSLQIVELQPEGKRPMLLSDYCNGHAWRAGMSVRSI